MEIRETGQSALPHHLTLHQRNLLDLEGVIEVEHFDELSVVVDTTLGELTVHGQNLHVRQLNLEDSVLSIEGRIDSLMYRESRKHEGLFRRILR